MKVVPGDPRKRSGRRTRGKMFTVCRPIPAPSAMFARLSRDVESRAGRRDEPRTDPSARPLARDPDSSPGRAVSESTRLEYADPEPRLPRKSSQAEEEE